MQLKNRETSAHSSCAAAHCPCSPLLPHVNETVGALAALEPATLLRGPRDFTSLCVLTEALLRSLPPLPIPILRCNFLNKQVIKLQEAPDMMPAGQTPHTVLLVCYDDFVETVQPGDRLEVTAIFRGTTMRPSKNHRTIKAVMRTFLDVLHFKRHSKGKLARTTTGNDADKLSESYVTSPLVCFARPPWRLEVVLFVSPSVCDDLSHRSLWVLRSSPF